ncbi:LamG-like jellyroll fold domain-containing protein [Actinomadura luteofluorescens]|uniref:LamG-like jellyroll fold domain-containing protein n=1 Tax=Actinomadura luteofluorescens TaxID=46163 RepID=UPI0034946422
MMVAALFQVPLVAVSPKSQARAEEPQSDLTEQQAVAKAKLTGESVEIVSQRGENRTVRALPNGRIDVEERLRPIRARQGNKWADIDTRLHRSGDTISPTVSTVGLKFSTGGTGPMAQMTRDGRKLALSWPEALPEPTLFGDTAVYSGVAGPDVDLRLRAQADGFAHVLVIKTAEAAKDPRVASLALAMSTTRLSVSEEQSSGVLKATDTSSGAVVFEAPSPFMWDSSQAASGTPQARTQGAVEPAEEPVEGAKTAPIDVSVEDGKLTLTPDQGMLTAPDTTFPVYIDPVWDTKKATSWGMVTSGWPDQSYYNFAGKSTEGMGRCEVAKDPNCVKDQTKRLFFRMPLPPLKGRYIQSAEFTPFETGAYNCDNPTSVQLWRTTTLQSYATWNNTNKSSVWLEHLASRDVVHCSKAPVEFGGANLRSHVQDAVNKGYGTITFGLKAYSESTMDWWKRFADDAYLHVQYNNPPKQPDTDTMFAMPGGSCVSGSPKWVNTVPKVFATLIDPDDEDKYKVQGQFTLHWANNADGSDWGPKWTSGLTAAKTSNTQFQQQLPSTIPRGKKIGWGVRAWDGEQWGPWSYDGAQAGCYFYYDPDLPAKPSISSTNYPEDNEWHDGVGIPGAFTISDSAQLADRYELWLNGFYYKTVSTTAGAARQVQIAPSKSGPNHLDVVAYTPSSQRGATYTYNFLANLGKPAKARFALDEQSGTSLQAVTREGEPTISATVHDGAVVGVDGQDGRAIKLDGSTGYASTETPIIDTSKSFAVAAWVWVDPSAAGNDFTALSAKGNNKSAFYLKYVKHLQRWVFARTAADSDDPGWWQAESATSAQVGTWTHLVGVWDSALKRLRIYVNGDVGTDSPEVASVWSATGGLQIGRAQYAENPVDFWPGLIDDVRVYDRSVGGPEVEELVKQYPVLKGRWKLNTAEGPASPGEPEEQEVPPLMLQNGAEISSDAGFSIWASPAGLSLAPKVGAFAETSLGLETDQSFTIAGWVRSTERPLKPATVFSQAGTNANAVTLRYIPGADPEDQGGWQAEMRNSDAVTTTPLVASHSKFLPGEWEHLAVVYDALRDRLSLYVNGELQQTADEMSEEDGVLGFKASNGGLQVGRSKLGAASGSEFWPDAIDDLWVYQGALSIGQIQSLAAPVERETSDGP